MIYIFDTMLYTDPDMPITIEYEADASIEGTYTSILRIWCELIAFDGLKIHEVDIEPVLDSATILSLRDKCRAHYDRMLRLEEQIAKEDLARG